MDVHDSRGVPKLLGRPLHHLSHRQTHQRLVTRTAHVTHFVFSLIHSIPIFMNNQRVKYSFHEICLRDLWTADRWSVETRSIHRLPINHWLQRNLRLGQPKWRTADVNMSPTLPSRPTRRQLGTDVPPGLIVQTFLGFFLSLFDKKNISLFICCVYHEKNKEIPKVCLWKSWRSIRSFKSQMKFF